MLAEDRAALIVHRLLCHKVPFDVFERQLVSGKALPWNEHVAFIADQIREATAEAMGHGRISDRFWRGELSADEAKELEARLWQQDYEQQQRLAQGLLDEEPDWFAPEGVDARLTSLEQRVTALEDSGYEAPYMSGEGPS